LIRSNRKLMMFENLLKRTRGGAVLCKLLIGAEG
jgi:hypothetical protein